MAWFRRKPSGLGWEPASWEGWGVTALFVLACLGISDPEIVRLGNTERMVCILALVAALLVVALATSERTKN